MHSISILCIGDIVGEPGRKFLKTYLSKILEEHHIHFTLANIENAAGGFGFTDKVYDELRLLPINAFTAGNHLYDKKEILKNFDRYTLLVRPLNFPAGNPGVGYRIFNLNQTRIAVVNLIGRVFMGFYDCPFQVINRFFPEIREKADIILVDIHAEATSEKQAMGWFLDGKATAVFGTHTHVLTADERILPQGTAYISDIGYVGDLDGILGMDRAIILNRFLTQIPYRLEVAKAKQVLFNGMKIVLHGRTYQVQSIERLQYTFGV